MLLATILAQYATALQEAGDLACCVHAACFLTTVSLP